MLSLLDNGDGIQLENWPMTGIQAGIANFLELLRLESHMLVLLRARGNRATGVQGCIGPDLGFFHDDSMSVTAYDWQCCASSFLESK